MPAGVLEAISCLVGEFAEVDLPRVRRLTQHVDVGAGTEHAFLAAGEHQAAHLRMLEAQTLQGVGELDVDAQIVGVELELIARLQAAILVDVERERRDRDFDLQPPVGVAVGMRIESHHSSSRLPPSGESCRAGPAALRNTLAFASGAAVAGAPPDSAGQAIMVPA